MNILLLQLGRSNPSVYRKVYPMTAEDILEQLPFQPPYRFLEGITSFDEEHLEGHYTFKETEVFYPGHFPQRAVTPGAILGEAASQAVLALGIYLVRDEPVQEGRIIFLTSHELRFKRIVFPGDKILLYVDKLYFRFHKLKCRVKVTTPAGETICRGTISGILIHEQDER